ncbi:hypothetical protein PO909_028649, partial [Leuciscus waleckii]
LQERLLQCITELPTVSFQDSQLVVCHSYSVRAALALHKRVSTVCCGFSRTDGDMSCVSSEGFRSSHCSLPDLLPSVLGSTHTSKLHSRLLKIWLIWQLNWTLVVSKVI